MKPDTLRRRYAELAAIGFCFVAVDVVPHPKKDLPKPTVRSILKQAGL